MAKVEAVVKEVFGPLSPRQDIQLDQLSALILDVRRKVEGDTPDDRKYANLILHTHFFLDTSG